MYYIMYSMTDISLRDHLIKASKKQKEKYSTADFQKWGKMSLEKRTAGMTTEEKSNYFKNIRNGVKVSD
jgi:hypothetical protein